MKSYEELDEGLKVNAVKWLVYQFLKPFVFLAGIIYGMVVK